MDKEAKKIACPAALRKRLEIFRVDQGPERGYFVKDALLEESHTFEPWQFYVLDVFFGCDSFQQLSSVFEDRYGKALAVEELDQLMALVEEKRWFSVDVKEHPVLVAYRQKVDGVSAGTAAAASAAGSTPSKEEESLPPGVHEALGMDESLDRTLWKLFDPRGLLKLLYPVCRPLAYTIYLLPLLLVLGIGILVKYGGLIEDDLNALRRVPVIEHLFFGMVTVNLLATWATSLVAYSYRATVSGFCIVFHFGVLPRFIAKIGHVQQLSRRERIWLHSAPLLLRLCLLSIGILLWFGSRAGGGVLSSFGLALALASALSLLITANPLIKSNGYHLICAYLDETNLQAKSARTLIDVFRGSAYKKAEGNVLAAYALASGVFVLATVTAFLYLLDHVLDVYLGGPSLLVLAIIGGSIAWGMVAKFKKIGEAYERTAQFEKWREQTIPEDKTETKTKTSSVTTYALRASAVVILVGMFVPYSYALGGPCLVLPERKQDITSLLSGLVEEIHFDGGEFLKGGTVIGRLSYADDEVEVKTLDAKIGEQEAVIAELKSRPLPEEVQVAERNLQTEETRAGLSKKKLDRMEELYARTTGDVQLAERKVDLAERSLKTAETRARFSAEKLGRTEDLYAKEAVSLEDLEDARREHDVDVDQVEEARANLEMMRANLEMTKDDAFDDLEDLRREHDIDIDQVEEARANLELIRVGAKPEQIEAAEEKLQGWKDERDYHLDRIEQSIYSMPFDATLVATRLKERIGSYIDKGDLLAVAENTERVIIQVDIPEPDVGYIREQASARCRLPAFMDEDILGRVTAIDSTVTEESSGPVVRISVLVENRDGRLKSGMTGYAKIKSETLPVWEVLSLGIVRFFKLEVWSWLP